MSVAVSLTDATFDEVIAAAKPTLVDFWAEWCGPCKAIAPVLDQIAEEHGNRLTVAKLDVDAYPDFVGRYGIRGIPHMMLFQDGEVVARIVGAKPKEDLLAVLLPLI